jgi:hypothetical protein
MTDFAQLWRERQEAVVAYDADETENMDTSDRVKEIELRIAKTDGQDAVCISVKAGMMADRLARKWDDPAIDGPLVATLSAAIEEAHPELDCRRPVTLVGADAALRAALTEAVACFGAAMEEYGPEPGIDAVTLALEARMRAAIQLLDRARGPEWATAAT